MGRVIAVVGAGGKSSYIERVADFHAKQGLRVCIATTTKIYAQPDRHNVCYIGKAEGVKLSYPGEEEFREICRQYDVILVEADGSHHMPLKIPAEYEPVIPGSVNEIVIIMGLQALGRRLGEVCQRVDLSEELDADSPVTSEMIDFIAEHYYIKPLRKKFPNIPINYIKNDLYSLLPQHAGKSVALVLMASGSSRRFGSDKLTAKLHGKELYRYGLDALIDAEKYLLLHGVRASVFMTVRSCEDITCEGAELLVNTLHREGISASIRAGTAATVSGKFNAVLFFAGDMPDFPGEDIARLVCEFLCSGKDCGCAYHNHPSNPAIFSSQVFPDLLKLSGDKGALSLITCSPERAHYYVVSGRKLRDIDTPAELVSFTD